MSFPKASTTAATTPSRQARALESRAFRRRLRKAGVESCLKYGCLLALSASADSRKL
jgi:hypothetical protein